MLVSARKFACQENFSQLNLLDLQPDGYHIIDRRPDCGLQRLRFTMEIGIPDTIS